VTSDTRQFLVPGLRGGRAICASLPAGGWAASTPEVTIAAVPSELTTGAARRIAVNITRLPGLLRDH
jgi:hypothetical protein